MYFHKNKYFCEVEGNVLTNILLFAVVVVVGLMCFSTRFCQIIALFRKWVFNQFNQGVGTDENLRDLKD